MANTEHENFLKDFRNWKPVNPESAPPTRESLRRELREHFVAKTGSETLADLSISHLETQADARVRLEASLHEDLARVDASIERFRRETPGALAPYEARVKTVQAELDAANKALKDAEAARESELMRGLEQRKNHILAELRGAAVPQGRVIGWREGGQAPQFPAGT